MSHFPYTCLIFQQDKSLVVAGPHFHIVEVHTGAIVHSTISLDDASREKITKSGPIRCAAVDSTFAHVASTGNDKKLKVWKIADGLELLSERELPKKPTEVRFTRDGQTIVISDKFGDVFSYPLHPPEADASTPAAGPSGASKRGSLTAHENPSNGTLVLGHASLLTTFILSPDEQYILTADRDEHIRVSWFPQGYAVERYCLGHERFVAALHIPAFAPEQLVSGGGDPVLKVWEWMSGRLLADIHVADVAEGYVKVRAPKRKRGWGDGDGDEEGGGEGGDVQGQKKGKRGRRGRKGKGKGKDDGVEAEKESVEPQPVEQPTAEEKENPETTNEPEDVFVFIVDHVQTVDLGEQGRHIVFSVIGSTALFHTPYPKDTSIHPVHAVDLEVPVVGFTVGENGDIWVSLDAEWTSAEHSSTPFARLLSWGGDTWTASKADTPLLAALNSKCLVPASAADLKTLDIYGALSSLPKNVDPEHDALIRDTLAEAVAADVNEDQLTQRELGRLKKKKALLAKIQEKEQLKRAGSEAEAEEQPEVKRTRSEAGASEVDVEMNDP